MLNGGTIFGSCTPDLYGEKHYAIECTEDGGTLTWISGERACQFEVKDCPKEWKELCKKGNNPHLPEECDEADSWPYIVCY